MSGLSIVIPIYGSAERLTARAPALRECVASFFDPIELIVVDDGGSPDLRTLRDELKDLRVLRNQRNLGKGAAVLAGAYAARQPRVLFTDADLPFDAESYRRVARELRGGAAAVIGCRRRADSEILLRFDTLAYTAWRHVLGSTFNRLVRGLTRLPYTDTQCGLKAFDGALLRTALQYVHESGFAFDVELLLACQALGVTLREVPVQVRYEDTKSTLHSSLESGRMARQLYRIWRRQGQGAYSGHPSHALAQRIRGLTHELDLTDH